MSTILTNFSAFFAQTTTAPAGGAGGFGSLLSSPLALIIPLMLVFFYFSTTSKRKQEKERKALLDSMKRGDRVQTIGGILGTIVEVRDSEIVVKVDESNNTKIKFARSAVSKVVGDDDKADADKKG